MSGLQRVRRKDAQRRPSVDILKTLDAVVVDVQDVGVHFYTYETTLGYFLEAAAKAGIEIIVLDRPNPITGSFVQGAIPDAGRESFVNYFPVPVRHGMTMGELAKMFNTERNINARLTVVPMEGWMRGDWYDSTGLTVDQSFAQHAQPHRSDPLPGRGTGGRYQYLRRAGHRHVLSNCWARPG